MKVVISDVRFVHEFNFIKEKGGYILKVFRDLDIVDNHLSETELDELSVDEYNYIILDINILIILLLFIFSASTIWNTYCTLCMVNWCICMTCL